jgi:serine/threonine-protein kinase
MPPASKIDLPERYRVARHIASGGMATVWEAEDQLLSRVVAVKVLASQYASDAGARARFQREARTAAQVSGHAHVVTIYDIGEHHDEAFIVMEYFAGGTVADRLRGAREGGEPIARETALRWLREAATGLDVAHDAGIVHRDVKPANLLLDAQDRLAVADFGIARLADDTQMTQTGQVLGTAAYISPEQALGQPAAAASDRYALAVVAYELLTGARPFTGTAPTAQALQHARDEPPRASQATPGLPPAIDPVLARGLAKDPATRPASACELVDAIEQALGAGATPEPTRPIAATAPTRQAPARPAVVPIAPSPPPPAQDGAAPRREQTAAPAASRRRWRPSPGLLGAIVVVCALVALVFALAGGNDPQSDSGTASGEGSATSDKARTATTPAAAAEPQADQGQQTQTPQEADSPETLNARGKALSDNGRYADAVAPLRAAVDAYKQAGQTDGLPYAFALYNLAVALNRSGSPEQAIPLLRERLKYDNQTETVQQELDDAIANLDAPAGDAEAQKPGKSNGKKNKGD